MFRYVPAAFTRVCLMPELDDVDARILGILMEDGRRSYREIARLTGITTPTAQARVKRMMDEGLIRKISPIFDPSKFQDGIVFLISFAVNPLETEKIGGELAKREEVRGIYLTTGEKNLTLRVVVDSVDQLQRFIESLDQNYAIKQNSSQMVVRIFKEDQSVLVRPGMGVNLKCETCNKIITGRPFMLKGAGSERFFCCQTCQEKFREQYGPRLNDLSLRIETP